jgi:hypothetical protein
VSSRRHNPLLSVRSPQSRTLHSIALNGVTSEACKAIHAQLLAAAVAGRQVRMYFSDSLSCSSHKPWSMLTGWYYGPEFVQ